MKFETLEVAGINSAMHAMRHALESYDRGDTKDCVIGPNDIQLMQNLIKGGPEHRKVLRMINVWVDISAPIFWWKEMDTYKVGVTRSSTSTMHKLTAKPISLFNFEVDQFMPTDAALAWANLLDKLEKLRIEYRTTKDENVWRALVELLPESYIQTSTLAFNYEVLRTIVHQRQNHKLKEWKVDTMKWIESLPYADEFIFFDNRINELEK